MCACKSLCVDFFFLLLLLFLLFRSNVTAMVDWALDISLIRETTAEGNDQQSREMTGGRHDRAGR